MPLSCPPVQACERAHVCSRGYVCPQEGGGAIEHPMMHARRGRTLHPPWGCKEMTSSSSQAGPHPHRSSHRAVFSIWLSLQECKRISRRTAIPTPLPFSSTHLPIPQRSSRTRLPPWPAKGTEGQTRMFCPRLALTGFQTPLAAHGQFALCLLAVTTGFAGDPEHVVVVRAGCGVVGAWPVPAEGCKR